MSFIYVMDTKIIVQGKKLNAIQVLLNSLFIQNSLIMIEECYAVKNYHNCSGTD